jgi:hypothetical protein
MLAQDIPCSRRSVHFLDHRAVRGKPFVHTDDDLGKRR